MKGVYISIGSNLNDRKKNLESAFREIAKIAKVRKASCLYESSPLGYKNQNNFYNAVVELEVDLEPLKLLTILKGIERRLGRTRTRRWGPRIIDLDILLYGLKIVNLPHLKIPHPQLRNRLFVLSSLLELNPELIDPGNGKKLSEYLSSLKTKQSVVKIANFNKKKQSWDEVI